MYWPGEGTTMDPTSKMDLGAVASTVTGAAAIVAGICGIVFWSAGSPVAGARLVTMVLAVVFGIAAIVLGVLALRRIRREPELRHGKAFAIVGMVLGSLVVLT